jgi:hypothetical protein
MMRKLGILGALALSVVVAQPAMAQERAVNLSVRGGGFNGLADLNEAGTADFSRVGYNVGGGVGVDLNRYFGLRGDFTFARNELEEAGIDTGSELARFFYDASVQARYPTASGLAPYAFLGAGAVTLHPVGTSEGDRTTAAGTVGLGVNYVIPGSNLGVLVEGRGWLYELSELGGDLASYDRTQFDVTWSAGLSYRLPFGSSDRHASR